MMAIAVGEDVAARSRTYCCACASTSPLGSEAFTRRNAAASAVDPAEISQHLPSQIGSPEAQLLARERVEIVARALENLSARQRSVFLMRFVEDMDLPDIASATGMPVPTVKTHLYRAIAAIRARFGDLP